MKSIFDGWTKKLEGIARDDNGGYCAGGWINEVCNTLWDRNHPVYQRIGKWIQNNLNPPQSYRHGNPQLDVVIAVVWANNEKKLDIEGFKMVDLLTQGYVPETSPEKEETHESAGRVPVAAHL